jgi:hypothetical protein
MCLERPTSQPNNRTQQGREGGVDRRKPPHLCESVQGLQGKALDRLLHQPAANATQRVEHHGKKGVHPYLQGVGVRQGMNMLGRLREADVWEGSCTLGLGGGGAGSEDFVLGVLGVQVRSVGGSQVCMCVCVHVCVHLASLCASCARVGRRERILMLLALSLTWVHAVRTN